jgi:hypothetical protein
VWRALALGLNDGEEPYRRDIMTSGRKYEKRQNHQLKVSPEEFKRLLKEY